MTLLVMKIQPFEFDSTNCSLPFRVDPGLMVGYLPVYATREDALADYPDIEPGLLVEVRKVEGE